MSHGNTIVVSAQPQGKFIEGYISGALKPGTMVQIKASVDPIGGRFTYEAFTPGGNGQRGNVLILREDTLSGQLMTTAYVSGARCFIYNPIMGEELNILVKNIEGTGDVFTRGDRFIAENASGKFLITTGTVESEPFECLEEIGPITEDTLVHVSYTGH